MFRTLLAFTWLAVMANDIVAQAPSIRAYKNRIAPHWFDNNDHFWYRNDLRGETREFILVDAVRGVRQRAFHHTELANALRASGIDEAAPDRLPIEDLEFNLAEKQLQFRADGRLWRCDLEDYRLEEVSATQVNAASDDAPGRLEVLPRLSRNTGAEIELRFVNQTDRVLTLYWLDTGGQRQPYGELKPGAEHRQHTYAGHVWLAVDAQENVVAAFEGQENPVAAIIKDGVAPRQPARRRNRNRRQSTRFQTSPDEKWLAQVSGGNVVIVNRETQAERPLTDNADEGNDYRFLSWSPDSRTLAAFRYEPGERQDVYLVESSPRDGGRAVLHQRPYALPGDKFDAYELLLFRQQEDTDDWQVIYPDVDLLDFGRPRIRWKPDGSALRYVQIDRGHQRLRVVEVAAATGAARHLLDERTDTFIWTAHAEHIGFSPVTWLKQSDEFIYASEVSGWRHLYLIDGSDSLAAESHPGLSHGGKSLMAPGLRQPITQGDFVVRGVEWIDEVNRQIWFRASGKRPDQDPYFLHFYRVNFDGTGLVELTAGDGNHSVQYSPDRRFLIDTYSRVDLPPVHELRRTEDGNLLCSLEQVDADELRAAGWRAPEVFVAKGRDGKTDIWGTIHRPRDFDPTKKYPVLEDLYAGPHSAYTPKSFSVRDRYAALHDLGFVVVKLDGMGTAHRSKAFHDVCWHRLKDAGFRDRILWMQAAGEKYEALDLNRVGVYGVSAGGQNAAAAVLFHGDFYKVAVAGCGCHDNRMDKASWNEQWMGYPVGPQYAESSNIEHADLLQGQLLLIVGEMDTNVPPESTLRFADALIKADKDFDLLVVPGAGHGIGGNYGRRRMRQFFVRHLIEHPPH